MRVPVAFYMPLLFAAVLATATAQSRESRTPDPSKPSKSSDPFENLLERALLHHPEVVLAEAKARQAQAELSLVRMGVAEAVQTLQNQRATAMARVNLVAQQLDQKQARASEGLASRESIEELVFRLDEAKQELALIEMKARNMVGAMSAPARQEASSAAPGAGPAHPQAALDRTFAATTAYLAGAPGKPALPDPVRKALEQPVLKNFNGVPCAEAIRQLFEPFNILVVFSPGDFPDPGPSHLINLSMKEPLPLKAVLAYLSDSDAYGLRFTPRDYGILVSH